MASAGTPFRPGAFVTPVPCTEPVDVNPDGERVAKSSMLDYLSAAYGGGITFKHRFCANTACLKSDLETIEPLRLCSRCYESHYCSTECQATHWKKHKESCLKAARKANDAEARTLCDPLESEMRREVLLFLNHTFSVELEYAAFIGFRLNSPIDHKIQDTHFIWLTFDYDARRRRSNRSKFTLTLGKLVPIEHYINACKSIGTTPSPNMIQSTLLAAAMADLPAGHHLLVGPDAELAAVPLRCSFNDISGRVEGSAYIRPQYFNLDRPATNPVEEDMSQDWLDVITRSLKGPAPRCFGELFDRTLRELAPHLDYPMPVPVTTFPDDTPEDWKESVRKRDKTMYLEMDWKQNMMDHRKLGVGGGVVSHISGKAPETFSTTLSGLVDLNEMAKKKEELKEAKA